MTEESEVLWAQRRDTLGLDDHLCILSRPFTTRLSHADWPSFIEHLRVVSRERRANIVVFDTIGRFAPWDNENDSADVTDALMPLDRLTKAGRAVLLAHHNGKSDQGEGKAIRGSTALTAAADILLELHRFRPDHAQDHRRVLSGISRFDGAPDDLLIARDLDGSYVVEGDRDEVEARELRDAIRSVLLDCSGMTLTHIYERLPTSRRPRSRNALSAVLEEGIENGYWSATGDGSRDDLRRYSVHSKRDMRRAPRAGNGIRPVHSAMS